jgi:hypothetical protein
MSHRSAEPILIVSVVRELTLLVFATMSDTSTQPQPIPAMTVAGNRNAKNVPVGPEGRDWSNGLLNRSGFWGTCAYLFILVKDLVHISAPFRVCFLLVPLHYLWQS